MARSLSVENLLPQNVGSIINYSNVTEVAQWGALSCSRPQPATENGVRYGRSNWMAVTPTLCRAEPPELHVVHGVNAGYRSQDLQLQPGRGHASVCMPGQLTAGAATQGIKQMLFADDAALVADSEEKLCRLVSEFGRVYERSKLRVNGPHNFT